MPEERYITNEVGCIVDTESKNLINYDGDEIRDLLNKQDLEIKELKDMNSVLVLKMRELDEIISLGKEKSLRLKYESEVKVLNNYIQLTKYIIEMDLYSSKFREGDCEFNEQVEEMKVNLIELFEDLLK